MEDEKPLRGISSKKKTDEVNEEAYRQQVTEVTSQGMDAVRKSETDCEGWVGRWANQRAPCLG